MDGTLIVLGVEGSCFHRKCTWWVRPELVQEVLIAGSKLLRLKSVSGLELAGIVLELFLFDVVRMNGGMW